VSLLQIRKESQTEGESTTAEELGGNTGKECWGKKERPERNSTIVKQFDE